MIFERDEETEVELQKGATTNEEAYYFEVSAPKIFNLTDGDSVNNEDIHSHGMWQDKPSGPFCVEA